MFRYQSVEPVSQVNRFGQLRITRYELRRAHGAFSEWLLSQTERNYDNQYKDYRNCFNVTKCGQPFMVSPLAGEGCPL